MNDFIVGDFKPLCKLPCEMSTLPSALEAGQPTQAGDLLWFIYRTLEAGEISEIQKACLGSWSEEPWRCIISSQEDLCGHTHCTVTGQLISLQPQCCEIGTLLGLP